MNLHMNIYIYIENGINDILFHPVTPHLLHCIEQHIDDIMTWKLFCITGTSWKETASHKWILLNKV